MSGDASESGIQLERITKFLTLAGLLKSVKEKEKDLVAITKNVIRSDLMDKDTIIYRISMMIFHSFPQAGAPLFKEVEDSGQIYLNLLQDEDMVTYLEENTRMKKLIKMNILIKTLSCFVIAGYAYYMAVQSGE